MHWARQLVVVILCSGFAAQALSGQEREIRSGVGAPSAVTIALDTVVPPAADLMVLKSTGWSFLWGAAGGGIGMIIDDIYCENEHGDEESLFFGPCFFYTANATSVGWFGGAAAGAAFGAVRVARQRGCSSRFAALRALSGALIGVAPGAFMVAARSEYSSRSLFIVGAPVLASMGATIALVDCRA